MCAHFTLKTKASEIGKKFGIKIFEDFNYDFRVRGFIKTDKAPIVLFENGQLRLKNAFFSLTPTWSKEFPCKFSTYNARLERINPNTHKKEFIYEVPTWKEAFSKGQTCLVPMKGAIESSYFGTQAGKMIEFRDNLNDFFFCLGLYNDWTDPNTGEVKETFTLLTDDPYKFFFESGHDRSIIVIKEPTMEPWLTNKLLKPQDRFNFIRNNRVTLDWTVLIDREMKKGWEKRAPSSEEIKNIKVWNS